MIPVLTAPGIAALVFDLFGTLCHWRPRQIYSPAFLAYALSADQSETDLTRLIRMFEGEDGSELSGDRLTEAQYWERQELIWAEGFRSVGVPWNQRVLAECHRIMQSRQLDLFPDAVGALTSISQAGVPWHICSNAAPDVLPKVLNALPDNVTRPIEANISWAVGALKPHPRMYQFTFLKQQRTADILFVGDRWEADVLGPLEHGLRAVLVERQDRQNHQADGRFLGSLSSLLELSLGS